MGVNGYFALGMRNVITGPNASGKSILTRLIASVAYPDHVAELSRYRDVDIEVRWFDPHTHDVATRGRLGDVTHILDRRAVPYVPRPYKTILLSGIDFCSVESVVSLAQAFDLSLSAMKSTLHMVAESSEIVREVHISGTRIDWTLDIEDRTIRTADHGSSRLHESA
ncbi:hypothetical protein GCM10009555_012470 [Acrocarpospora macrocephala]|uniref:Rad50/SbcC-type AAA domain-containing protein n=1 Tax=Acrocarpospora macrocephala TaxID=150177 RepID=A0A5M3X5V0_9ACTN|nr:hypothetical protein Amac_100580 [Acrocarpospora macrocephala]